MIDDRPTPMTFWQATATYLDHAYATGLPKIVQARLDLLRSASGDGFYERSVFERGKEPAALRFGLRLGNRFYPHMKLVLERAPLGAGWLFRVDSHDRHACPDPGSADYDAFCVLMANNQHIAQAIESAWAQQGLPTFKSLLREDLARRSVPAAEVASRAVFRAAAAPRPQ